MILDGGGGSWCSSLWVEPASSPRSATDRAITDDGLCDGSHWRCSGSRPESARGEGAVPVTLAHNVATEPEVDAILELAASLGAETSRGARSVDWGGYTGYFADPDGFRWEIAVQPGDAGPPLTG